MSLIASNVALRSYLNTSGTVTEDSGWVTSAFVYTGCNPNYNHNRVLVIRFTVEKFAGTVTIPLTCGSTNSSTSTKLLCYGMGGDPETDTSMLNVTGGANALGAFHFAGTYTQQIITLHNVASGTHYLYIWGQNLSDYSLTNVNAAATVENGITYEELEALCHIGNESYQCYVRNGSDWDLCVPYVRDGSNWYICS